MNQIVGIADMKVSCSPEDVLITYSLGSCVGLALYDPVARVGGMVHCMLPLSKLDEDKARTNPWMFTDTGVMGLLQAVFDLGAERKRLVAKIAGAALLLDEKKFFKIGERNYTVLRKVLWKNDILIAAEAVGGSVGRTLSLHMATGQTFIKSCGKEELL